MPKIAGRGATENQTSRRFNLPEREVDGDWMDDQRIVDGDPPRLKTTVTVLKPKTIISYNKSPDIGFDRSINPFAGCEHGCIYCYARSSHAYHDLSPGLDFESRLFAKPSAAALLRTELAKPNYRAAPIAIGTNTDGYQPAEREWGITRSILEILLETRHPLYLTTKSDRLLRDIDLLAQMAHQQLVAVAISITTLDADLARRLEPRAPHPQRRLAAVRALCDAGIPVQVNLSPIIPAITDHEIETLIAAASSAGAHAISSILLRLPHEVAPLFRAWLAEHFPDRAAKVMHIVQETQGGRDYQSDFFTRMKGRGIWADLIRQRVRKACQRHSLITPLAPLRCDLFTPPCTDGQLSLF